MSLTLILMRHAKSDRGDPALGDHDRPLSDRGRHAAPAMARALASRGHLPGELLASTAARCTGTWALMAPHMPADPRLVRRRELYLAEPPEMLRVLAGAGSEHVLMLGHNPGMADLAAWLAARPPDHPKFGQFPTAAALVLSIEAPGWANVGPRSGQVTDFLTPRDLIGM